MPYFMHYSVAMVDYVGAMVSLSLYGHWSTNLWTQQKQVCSMNDHEKGHLLTTKPITESHPSSIYQRKHQGPYNQAY